MTAIYTASQAWRKVRRTNSTRSSFVAVLPTKAQPVNTAAASGTAFDYIFTAVDPKGGGLSQNIIQFMFYGTGSNNHTFSANVYGFAPLMPFDASDPEKNIWLPTLLASVTGVTLSSTLPGIAGTPVVATELFADTISLAAFVPSSKASVSSPTGDLMGAVLELDFSGFPVLLPEFSIASGSTTDMNAVYRMF